MPIKSDAPCTVDLRHTDFLRRFKEDEENTLPKLRVQLVTIQESLKQTHSLEQHISLVDDYNRVRKLIHHLENRRTLYFLDNCKDLFGYFEEKKKIAAGSNENVKVLHKFFNLGTDKETMVSHAKSYMSNVDNRTTDLLRSSDTTTCQVCNKGELIPLDCEGKVICNNRLCSIQQTYLVEHEKPSYKDPPKEVCYYAYKRINHFREILAQIQAKECTQIPEEIIQNILAQIKKERLELSSMSNKKMKEILKKFGYNKYYEHIPYIKFKLGISPPVMSPEIEETLCNLFIEIQRPYAKYCPPDRVNFLNYYYTIYKLCEIIGETQFLTCFPMLKDREKRIEQDDIWKKICNDLNWEFIPTV
jgi:hypothetical protein